MTVLLLIPLKDYSQNRIKMSIVRLCLSAFLLVLVLGKETTEKWGYVTVRPGAQMFWWLYQYNGAKDYKQQPLILWLQGGPGAASSGFGNFWEVGPLDINLKPRNYSWIEKANVVFVDQPVGTGFSYVDYYGLLTRNNQEIADDLVAFSIAFFKEHPEFQDVPFYVAGESYGGKMAITYALSLKKAIASNKVRCRLTGLALIDSWISPMDYVHSWAPYLYSFSLIDEMSYSKIQEAANKCQAAFDAGSYAQATNEWGNTEMVILRHTNNVNFYNVLTEDHYSAFRSSPVPEVFRDKPNLASLYSRHVTTPRGPLLNSLMNGAVKKKLGIPHYVTWGSQSANVFTALSGDFMKPVIDEVDELLKARDVEIIVITGQLDLIVDTLGTNMWLQKLKWEGFPGFNNSLRLPISIPSDKSAGFVKPYKKLIMYYMLKAGHLVPGDAPEASFKMLDMILFGQHLP